MSGELDPLVFEKLRLACMKAVLLMDEAGISQFSMIAAAVAAKILKHFRVPFMTVAGFCHIPDQPWSYPHVWLQTDSFITDLTYSHKSPERNVMIAGQSVGFCEGSFKASYDAAAKYPIIEGALSIELMHETSRNLDAYLAGAPQQVQAAVPRILAIALDNNTNKVQLSGEAAKAAMAGVPTPVD